VEHQHRVLPGCRKQEDVCADGRDLPGLHGGAQQRPVLAGAAPPHLLVAASQVACARLRLRTWRG